MENNKNLNEEKSSFFEEKVSSSNSKEAKPKLRFKQFEQYLSKSKLRKICNINPNNKGLPDEFYYIDLECVENGEIINELNLISKDDAPSRAQRLLQVNDMLYQTVRPYQKNNFLFTKNNDFPTVASTGYAQIRSNVNNIHYIYQLLHTDNFVKDAMKRSTGTSYPAITSSDLAEIEVYYPEVEEQNKIAKFLSLVDERIEKQRLLVENLKKYKRGLLSQLLNQNLTINKSNKQWNVVKLSQILKERKIYCEKDGTYEHATLSKEGVSGKTERYERDFLVSDENKKYKITKKGDICYNPANLKFGVICLNTYGDAIFSPIYITFEINQNCNKEFIGYYLTRADFINRALKYQQGTVYERMAVSPEDLLSMEIALPDINEQNKIAKILCCFEDKIKNESSKFEKLKRMKSALLQQMFI